MADWREFLYNIYFNVKQPGAFAGPNKLHTILTQNGYVVKIDEIKKWLQKHDAYTLFKPIKYRFKRNRIVTTGLDYMWDADLAEVGNIAEHNDGYRYLLVAIDVFSRYLWIEPVKTKQQNEIKSAFERIFAKTNRRPQRLRTDKGKEFINKTVRTYLTRLQIKAFTTKNETKANYAERVIRTVKTLLYRYFHQNQTYRYVEVLQDLVYNYNNRPHSSLGTKSPAQIDKNNEAIVWKRMYIDSTKRARKRPYKYKLGDKVRISHLKYQFQRDFHQKWTEEFFKVYHRTRKGINNMYLIKDMLNEQIDGSFYENELQRIDKEDDPVLRIEKVIKRRKKGKEILVKYMGWPPKFNAWISAENVQKY